MNTILWNTIQLLFPQEVEARKAVVSKNNREEEVTNQSHVTENNRVGTRSGWTNSNSMVMNRESVRVRSRRSMVPSQAEDAALALRLQREEFMVAFRAEEQQEEAPQVLSARANLRAMASRAINLRIRGRRI